MIRVAFWFDRPEAYTGGLNYLKNLLFALDLTNDGTIYPLVFFGRRMNAATLAEFARFAQVVHTSILDRWTFAWLVHKLLYRVFGRQWMVTWLMRRHSIDVVSHAEHVHGRRLPFRLISWIPDFQYLHLPELFPRLDTSAETRRIRRIVTHTDLVLLSSHAALEDFRRIAPAALQNRVRVLHFVSQPAWEVSPAAQPPSRELIEQKYGFQGRFFFLPNQFWQHKNHLVVFEAVRLLKQSGQQILLLCTGNLRDYRLRNSKHAQGLREFIQRHGLEDCIRILGMIDYCDVLFLMRHCLALLNPSRFEGWSSTVEEGRSLGKRLVLSDIAVHREQDASNARYFSPDDAPALAAILAQLWDAPPEECSSEMESRTKAEVRRRTLAYGRGYIDLVEAVMRDRGMQIRSCPEP